MAQKTTESDQHVAIDLSVNLPEKEIERDDSRSDNETKKIATSIEIVENSERADSIQSLSQTNSISDPRKTTESDQHVAIDLSINPPEKEIERDDRRSDNETNKVVTST